MADCRCYRSQIVVKNVLLEVPSETAGFSKEIDREKFSALVKKIIEQSPHFYFDADSLDGEVLHLALVPPVEGPSPSTILLAASLSPGHEDGARVYKSFADVKLDKGGITGGEIGLGLSKALQNLYQLHAGSAVDNATYIEKINASLRGDPVDGSELMNAVSVLGDTRDQKALQPLIKLLSTTTDLAIGNASLIALSEMGNDDAMQPIIDFVERKPPIIRRQAIIAAKRIGSKLAAEWLLVMAYGYDDAMVRKEALSALNDVENRLASLNR